eukprot:CAMPEP_0201952204 /NCGR_PEP_ID=MMETSP0904-20121228/1006_1 /ASSEMBLY_ACC=CAM_ASM_000553 /TAXON_ID=420261 /ORGANISM="Thalassiosira antarctica, Strain CCMP982" /LENGTH=485 /DNA_ID=CAMNT_0048495837 /DNA_START=21 /DNA_END=1478 /DNA_ORIENTATION=+
MIRSMPRIRSLVSRSRPSIMCKSLSSSLTSSLSLTSSSSPLHHLKTCANRQYTHYSRQKYNTHFSITAQSKDWSRQFSSSPENKKEKKKDLRESIERLKNESNAGSSEESNNEKSDDSTDSNPHVEKITSMGFSFIDTISETWQELVASGQAKDINKTIGTPTTDGGDGDPNANDDEAADKYEEYKGSKDIMLVDPQEHLSAWERMERRLRDAPIISDILERSEEAYEKSGARDHVQKTQQKVQHLKEDAEEAWETSQNPWVYRASSVYDTLTAETEFATATRQLQKLDPDFTLENWKRDVVEHTLPNIMKSFLEGRIQELKPWLGEAVYNRLAAEGRARKKEGVQMDTNVLAIMNAEILACELEGSSVNVERGDDPIILLHFMCQQIHCVRKKVVKDKDGKEEEDKEGEDTVVEEDTSTSSSGSDSGRSRTYMEEELGDIVEGSEDDIRANSYVVAFQREYNEEKMELNWKIVDFRFNGAIAYL